MVFRGSYYASRNIDEGKEKYKTCRKPLTEIYKIILSIFTTAVFEELRQVFKTTVIEAYGMTEASHQMTSNPMPPQIQKAGFVGKPAGPEVCIMDAVGNIQKNGHELSLIHI